MLNRGGWVRGRQRLGRCHVQRREDVLQEPNTLGCYANGLLTAMPMRGVHDGKTHIGHRRDNGQFHQPFLLKLALKPFRKGFRRTPGRRSAPHREPRGVRLLHSVCRARRGTLSVAAPSSRMASWRFPRVNGGDVGVNHVRPPSSVGWSST